MPVTWRYTYASTKIIAPHSVKSCDPIPFETVEEAWFWFIRCQKMRNEGLKYSPTSPTMPRPCEPVDVYCAAKRLHEVKRLSEAHLEVLSRYGMLECPPDSRNRSEQKAVILWDEALDRMLGPLRQKGIVAMAECLPSALDYTYAKQ